MIQERDSAAAPISVPRLLAIGISARVVIDTGVQIFGPFLELIARGMGISIVTLGWLNSLRNLTGLATPLAGVLAERMGYRLVMRVTLWLGSAGLILFAATDQLWISAVGMVVMGLGLFPFVPVFQAYLSSRIEYGRRAQALGVLEYAWALAGIFGLSLSGLLIGRYGWRAPFLMLGVFLFLTSFLFSTLPPISGHRSRAQAGPLFPGWRALPGQLGRFVALEGNARSAWSAMIVTSLNVFAISHVGIVYGSWLNREYGLSAVELGSVALLLGVIDLMGSVLVSLIADRVGKYRTLLLSTAGAFIAYALLPFFNISLVMVIIGLVLVRFTFEVSMVSNISLLSEQVPQQRAKVLTMTASFVTMASAISSITGPYAYSRWTVEGLAIPAAFVTFLAFGVLVLWVREQRAEKHYAE